MMSSGVQVRMRMLEGIGVNAEICRYKIHKKTKRFQNLEHEYFSLLFLFFQFNSRSPRFILKLFYLYLNSY